jgi:hypothetical protein
VTERCGGDDEEVRAPIVGKHEVSAEARSAGPHRYAGFLDDNAANFLIVYISAPP